MYIRFVLYCAFIAIAYVFGRGIGAAMTEVIW
jgi:hypothetical protein